MCCYADMSLASPLISFWRLGHSCYAQCLSPQNWENKTSTAMQKHKGVYCDLELGLKSHPAQWSGARAWTLNYSSIYKFRTKTGSWQGLIGCRGFLVFADWPVIISLIGQSYHPRKPRKHDSGIIFGLVHLSEPVMAQVRSQQSLWLFLFKSGVRGDRLHPWLSGNNLNTLQQVIMAH